MTVEEVVAVCRTFFCGKETGAIEVIRLRFALISEIRAVPDEDVRALPHAQAGGPVGICRTVGTDVDQHKLAGRGITPCLRRNVRISGRLGKLVSGRVVGIGRRDRLIPRGIYFGQEPVIVVIGIVHRIGRQPCNRHRAAVREIVEGIDRLIQRLPDELFFLARKPAETIIDIGRDAVVLIGLCLLVPVEVMGIGILRQNGIACGIVCKLREQICRVIGINRVQAVSIGDGGAVAIGVIGIGRRSTALRGRQQAVQIVVDI